MPWRAQRTIERRCTEPARNSSHALPLMRLRAWTHAYTCPSRQQWRYNAETGAFVYVRGVTGVASTPLCLRRFAEAQSFAAWACSGAQEETFVPITGAGGTIYCTGEGAYRACVGLSDTGP